MSFPWRKGNCWSRKLTAAEYEPMLTIRKEQMAIFQDQLDGAFIDMIIEHLRRYHFTAVQADTDDTLKSAIADGLGRADAFGLTRRKDLIAFVTMMFEIGADFASCPVFQKYLADPEIPVNEKMARLLHETTDDDWQTARRMLAEKETRITS